MRAVVTGVSSGIGLATALRFAGEGWEVVGLSRTKPPRVKGLKWIRCDLTERGALTRALKPFEEIDAAVHCAFTYEPECDIGKVGELALEELWDATAARLSAHGGALVVLSSVAVLDPQSEYAKDKVTQERLAMGFARAGSPAVRANIVRPHRIAGTRTHPSQDHRRAEELPLKRFGDPAEVAACVWLAATCGYMTGSVITVDGGFTMGRKE